MRGAYTLIRKANGDKWSAAEVLAVKELYPHDIWKSDMAAVVVIPELVPREILEQVLKDSLFEEDYELDPAYLPFDPLTVNI